MKTITTLFVTFAMLMLFAGSAHATNGDPCAYGSDVITGYVVDGDNEGIDGATVNASCLSNGCTSNTVSTTPSGQYVVVLNCPIGASVEVTAANDGNVITVPGVMEDWTYVTIAFVNVILTPEFGLIAIPLLLSMAGFVFMKGRIM